MDGPVEACEGLAIALDKGRIVDLVPTVEAHERFAPSTVHSLTHHIAIPGLINAHCHAAMTLFRGIADDLPLDAWLGEKIWPLEGRFVDRDFVADGTRLAIAEMLRHGITCFADMYYFPDVVAAVASEAGMRASVGMIALEFPTVWARSVDEYIDKGLEVHDRYRGDPLISTTFAPHAPYTVSDGTLTRIRKLADELEIPVHTHLHETRKEVNESLAEHGMRPLARLETLGLATPLLVAVHATQIEQPEVTALADAGASVVHCPRANLKLASGACPVGTLHSKGANIALGTDGAAGNNRLDILGEMQYAALLGKHTSGDATAVTAEMVLRFATINGARALGLDGEIGSLTPGKAADIVCLDLSGPGQIPVYDPISTLVYATGCEQVTDVWIAGAQLVRSRELVPSSLDDYATTTADWQHRLSEAL